MQFVSCIHNELRSITLHVCSALQDRAGNPVETLGGGAQIWLAGRAEVSHEAV